MLTKGHPGKIKSKHKTQTQKLKIRGFTDGLIQALTLDDNFINIMFCEAAKRLLTYVTVVITKTDKLSVIICSYYETQTSDSSFI